MRPTMGRTSSEENTMAKYLLLKHYRGAPAPVNDVPMDRWTPEELTAHVQYMKDFAARLEATGEFVDSRALSPASVLAVTGRAGVEPGGPSRPKRQVAGPAARGLIAAMFVGTYLGQTA